MNVITVKGMFIGTIMITGGCVYEIVEAINQVWGTFDQRVINFERSMIIVCSIIPIVLIAIRRPRGRLRFIYQRRWQYASAAGAIAGLFLCFIIIPLIPFTLTTFFGALLLGASAMNLTLLRAGVRE